MHNYSGLSISIEVGAYAIKVLAAELDEKTQKLQFIAISEQPYPKELSDVVIRGEVCNIVPVEKALKDALDELDSEGCNLSEAHYYFIVKGRKTSVGSTNHPHIFQEKQRVTQEDLDKVEELLLREDSYSDTEIIYNRPSIWLIGNEERRSIIGYTCKKFTQQNFLVYAQMSLTRHIFELIVSVTAHNPSFYTYGPIASATAILNEQAKSKGSLVIDLGEEVTEYCLFHNGNCNYAMNISVGVKHLINDLSIGLECPYSVAKEILIKYGNALQTEKNSERVIELHGKHYRIQSIELIIHLRLAEIIKLIYEDLKEHTLVRKIGNAIYITGCGSKIANTDQLIKNVFSNIPVYRGQIAKDYHQIDQIPDNMDHDKFSAVAGLAIMGHNGGDDDEETAIQQLKNFVISSFQKFTHLLKGE
jgi:cell division protein FtsA